MLNCAAVAFPAKAVNTLVVPTSKLPETVKLSFIFTCVAECEIIVLTLKFGVVDTPVTTKSSLIFTSVAGSK